MGRLNIENHVTFPTSDVIIYVILSLTGSLQDVLFN